MKRGYSSLSEMHQEIGALKQLVTISVFGEKDIKSLRPGEVVSVKYLILRNRISFENQRFLRDIGWKEGGVTYSCYSAVHYGE